MEEWEKEVKKLVEEKVWGEEEVGQEEDEEVTSN